MSVLDICQAIACERPGGRPLCKDSVHIIGVVSLCESGADGDVDRKAYRLKKAAILSGYCQ